MKLKFTIILLWGLGILCQGYLYGKDFTEHISREFTLQKSAPGTTLFIYNISGFIRIEGTQGNKVLLEAEKTVSADNDGDLETGKKEFRVGFAQGSDSIVVYISSPFDSRPNRGRHNYGDDEPGYDFNLDFTVKVPAGINLHISTVNNGIIEVNNVEGILHVNNVNDAITIKNAKSKTRAHTVNGDVIVTYVANPPDESSYQTINGDIRISYLNGLSADMTFKTMNGEFYTDFPEAQLLPASAAKTQEKKGGRAVYKLNNTTTVRFGKGGKVFSFETLNGDVYIKKQS